MKLKGVLYYENFTFEYLVPCISFHSTHSCTLNVCDNNVYKAQRCTLFYYSTDKCTGQWRCGITPKEGLPNPRGSLVSKIPSQAIEQANKEVRQEDCASNQVSNA